MIDLEIQVLVKNNNSVENWDKVLVSDKFDHPRIEIVE